MKNLFLLLMFIPSLFWTGCSSNQSTLSRADSEGELIGEWSIFEVLGQSLLSGTTASIGFAADGRLFGNTGLNRLLGQWNATDQILALSNIGMTRMAGDPALMKQESIVIDAVQKTAKFVIVSADELSLFSEDGDLVIKARR